MKAGIYTIQQILDTYEIELPEDRRRLKVGGLSFDSTDKVIRVPASAETLEITLDGEVIQEISIE